MSVYQFEGIKPVIHPTAYVHPSAVIIGDVWIGENCYIGPFASVRGDFNRIVIKKNSNVQDSCTIHGFPDHDCVLEESSHLGHGCIVHTSTIGKNALIGMQALVMDYAEVGENAIVAAQSLVPSYFKVPPGTLAMGSPVKIVKELSEETILNKSKGTAYYVKLAQKSLTSLEEVEPLTEGDFGRTRLDWGSISPIRTQSKNQKLK